MLLVRVSTPSKTSKTNINIHNLGVVDMDLFGAFQLCSIGILAAPLTVRLSRTYFFDPGRNIIFLWTILILCGLVALCVEFYRITPTDCITDDDKNPIHPNAANFPYGHATCNLTCSEEYGPFSPMRGGAAANVNVIPVPSILTFNASMLLSAGFCIPAILSLIFTLDKVLEINWKRRRDTERLDDRIEGANITVREMKGINNVVRLFLSVIEIPLFGGVILTIIGIGEANFFSAQIRYDTEPMGSIGKKLTHLQIELTDSLCSRAMEPNRWDMSGSGGVFISALGWRRDYYKEVNTICEL